ncbi:MAG TPA: ABC transporter permease [Candidatus Saccharimonadales bacterium]|nr:ABC transporter permease [Candidatus Saccharimonadales bacterium]
MLGISLGNNLKAGISTLKTSKGRSFGIMLGIIIGVMSVITILAIGDGIKNQISGQIHKYGQNVITIKPAQLTFGSSGNAALASISVLDPLTNKDINTVSKVNGVSAVAPLTLVPGSPKGDYGAYHQGFVIGTNPSLPSLINQSLAYGNFFSDSNNNNGDYVAVLGQNAADAMFKENVPLGSSFTFHGQTFVVDGIFNTFNSAPLSQQANFNNAIFIPNSIAESLTNNTAPTYEILARSAVTNQTNITAKNIASALNDAHGGASNLTVNTDSQDLSNNNSIINLTTGLVAGVAAISLLVAGIGIMNVMLVSVSERVREIGIRKAVGATNRQIRSQFIAEATFLSLSGALIGIALSFVIELFMRLLTSLTPTITWQSVVIVTGVSVLVGIVFGTVPAIKASRKDPIEALRAE